MLLSFYHSVCVEDFCKSNPPISLKLDVMIGRVFDRSEELTNIWWQSDPGYGFRIIFPLLLPLRSRGF